MIASDPYNEKSMQTEMKTTGPETRGGSPPVSAPRPILITGYMRSGTTLLCNVLKNHPDAFFVAGETDVFGRLPLLRRAFPDLEEDAQLRRLVAVFARGVAERRAALEEELFDPPLLPDVKAPAKLLDAIWAAVQEAPRRHAEVFRIVVEHFARQAGKSFWVKKGLAYTTALGEMRRALPGLKLAGIVRDPRDVLASKKTRRTAILDSDRLDSRERARQHTRRNYDPLWDTLAWRTALRVMHRIERAHEGLLHLVRYEDLVTAPEKTVRRLCRALELSFADEMVAVQYRNSSEESKRSDTDQKQGGGGIRADSVARWRGVLSPADVVVSQQVAHAEMERHGYERVVASADAWGHLPLTLGRSAVRFATRLYGKWKVGGPVGLVRALRTDWQRLRHIL